jgi:Holliday junction DNA helicase RuvA
MISFLRGTLTHKSGSELVIDVGGVGYSVTVPATTAERVGPVNAELTILTLLHVREDLMQLFGFATEQDRDLFKLLLGVSGIGPKIALAVLSGLSASATVRAIATGDAGAFTGVQGIGKKTAERIIMELRDRLPRTELTDFPAAPTSKQLKVRTEAIVALMALGHTRSAAEQALRNVLLESPGTELTVEELIRRALRHTGS